MSIVTDLYALGCLFCLAHGIVVYNVQHNWPSTLEYKIKHVRGYCARDFFCHILFFGECVCVYLG